MPPEMSQYIYLVSETRFMDQAVLEQLTEMGLLLSPECSDESVRI